VLFIAHDLALVGRIAERIVVLYLGRVVEEGPATRDPAFEPQHPYTVALLSAVPSPQPGATAEPHRAGRRASQPGASSRRLPLPSALSGGRRALPNRESPDLRCLSEGRRVACHFPGRLTAEITVSMVEPFANPDVKKTDASHGATQ
jgi:peptide/nickel transport system ATP-binding protein